MKKVVLYATTILLLLALVCHAVDNGWVPAFGGGKIDTVVAIYESENQPVSETNVLNGSTANAMRKVGKWKQYDQNQIPEQLKPAFDPVVAKLGVPCLILIRGGKVSDSMKAPPTNDALAELIEKKGGY